MCMLCEHLTDVNQQLPFHVMHGHVRFTQALLDYRLRILDACTMDISFINNCSSLLQNVEKQQKLMLVMACVVKPQLPPSKPPLTSSWRLWIKYLHAIFTSILNTDSEKRSIKILDSLMIKEHSSGN
ncbi:hypothetical protein M0802_004653 [Mischocyttarus mexicanus]|nr:hypothetical protein M0802_004653 [Mischocyttarus mexicanus]